MNALTELIRSVIAERRETKLKGVTDGEKRAALLAAYEPETWLDDAARRSSWTALATHAAKFTHGDSKTSNVYDGQTAPAPFAMVSTMLVADPAVDIVGNAAAIDVARLLLLDAGEGSLIFQLRAGDFSALTPFTDDAEKLQEWVKAFCAVAGGGEPHAHKYGKEVFFPVADGYHMLSPLFPTSLYHVIHQRINEARFGDEAKAAAAARKKGEYHPGVVTFFPDVGVMNMCKSNPQTRSYLNSQRGGRVYLLPCTPPEWKANGYQLDDPTDAIQRRDFQRAARPAVAALRDFLLSTGDYNNVAIRGGVVRRIGDVIDALIMYLANVQRGEWPEEWPELVSVAFARWLAREMRGKDNKLNAQKTEIGFFTALCLNELTEYQEATA
ncbi:TPA: type I-F CRISPR-associated protein Csy1 [Enterobacter hormaechei subsp. xiangfangensis]|nr:type I-F CRISPR-associated protein Csy1 [Enterobacter hormaechei subsp. xiangfangensis]